ncbi:MAG: hypothetical protein AMXMBFR34_14290 [Myxococcaceae bacterium]
MRKSLICALWLAGCSGASGTDGGTTDAGTDAGVDAGAQCFGVPPRLTQYTCVAATGRYPITCEATLEVTLAQHPANLDCDAGPGVLGYAAVGECPESSSVSWVYGFPGDTYECFYAKDGGAWTGGINSSDRGVFLAGTVGDCPPRPVPACRDGG